MPSIAPSRPAEVGGTAPFGTASPAPSATLTTGGGQWPGGDLWNSGGSGTGGGTTGYLEGGTTVYPEGEINTGGSAGYPWEGQWLPTTEKPWLQDWDSMMFEPNFYSEFYKDGSGIWPFEGARCPNRSSTAVHNPNCEVMCYEDSFCPTFELCCPNGCGRVCVPPVFPEANTTDAGCSVSFIVDFRRTYNFNRNISLIFNLVWESLHQGFSPELQASFFFYNLESYGSYFTPETVTNVCELEDALNDIQRWEPVLPHSLLAKPTRVLIAIVTEEGDMDSSVWQYYQHYAEVFSSFCVIVVGNPDIADNITQSLSCVWRVASFEELPSVTAKVIEKFDSHGCFIEADESCPTEGSACNEYNGCSRKSLKCINGTCQAPSCPLPDSVPNYKNDRPFCYYYGYGGGSISYYGIESSYKKREITKHSNNSMLFDKGVSEDQQRRFKEAKNKGSGHEDIFIHHKPRSGLDIKRKGKPGFPPPEVGAFRSDLTDQAVNEIHKEICNDSKPTYVPCRGLEGKAKEDCLRVKDPRDAKCNQMIDRDPIQDTSTMMKALRNGKPLPSYFKNLQQQAEEFREDLVWQPVPSRATQDKQKLRSSRYNSPEYYLYKQTDESGCCAEGLLKCAGVPAMCLYGDLLCDGVKHCLHGEDEDNSLCTNRTCAINEFRCKSGQCIEARGECDGRQDCTDGSDEHCQEDSDCPSSRSHYCSSGECIYPSFLCDNIIDCQYGEDEKSCDCTGFKCTSGECMPYNIICDGYKECSDGSDEANSTCKDFVCPENAFKCGSGSCIKQHLVCNNHPDCEDGSDENYIACSNKACLPREWKCGDGKCIPDSGLCNGWNDCSDASDESTKWCGKCDQFLCGSGECISNYSVCDNYRNCQDKSDEKNCSLRSCHGWEFQCSSGECIPEYKVQDGREYCSDGSDEYKGSCFSSYKTYQCTSGECIDEYQVCNGIYDCKDRKDEAVCKQVGCPSYRSYKCESGQCVWNPSARCNGYSECLDGSDEKNCTGVPCPDYTSLCKNGVGCITSYALCNGYRDCDDGSDEENCTDVFSCGMNNFQCGSGECVSRYVRCDGIIHCRDRSDERNCNGSVCAFNEILCKSGECIDACNQCNGAVACLDGSDETDCASFKCPSDRPYHCDSGECLPNYVLCDGSRDCSDGSDETKCPQLECPVDRSFQCSTGQCIHEWLVCNGYRDCRDGSDETLCNSTNCPANRPFYCGSGECIYDWEVCDGWNNCKDGSDENCTSDMCPDTRPFFCPTSRECFSIFEVCNGFADCADGSDEDIDMCKSFTCPNTTFKCNSGKCISMNYVCDVSIDCPEGDDEVDCENFIRPCASNDFRCDNNHCIRDNWVCDGYKDCTDGKDEIGCSFSTGQITSTTSLPTT